MTAPDRQDAPAGLPAVVGTGTALATVPAQLREIAEVAGAEAALTIHRLKAGQEIWIPLRADADHWLTRAVGAPLAERICAHFRVENADGREVGNVRIYAPLASQGAMARAKAQLAEDLRTGQLSLREAALRAGLSERTARTMLARIRDTRQGELFEAPAPRSP